MKTLNKTKVLLTLLFFTGLTVWFFADFLTTLLHKDLSLLYLVPGEVYKWTFLGFLCAISVYYYGEDIREKSSVHHRQYFDLFRAHPSPMAIIDKDTSRILAVNHAAVALYGYSKDEFLNLNIADIRAGEQETNRRNGTSIPAGLHNAGVHKHRKKNGDIILSEVSSCEIYFKGRLCRLILAGDITEMVKAKEAKMLADAEVVKQQSFTSFVLENFPVDVAVFDTNHKYIFVNKTAVKNDTLREWLIGKDDFDYFLLKGSDLNIAQQRRDRFLRAVRGESSEWIDEYVTNGEVKYVLRKFFPCWENGEIKYVYGYGTDITEIKKAQDQREAYVRQLEDIAFITSHKIRQPICNLQGLISLLEMEKYDTFKYHEIVTCLKNSVLDMDGFTRDLAEKLNAYKQNLASRECKE